MGSPQGPSQSQGRTVRVQRMSRQRRAVLADLHAHPQFRGAQDIHASLVEAGVNAGLATVYRNLQVLEESGQVDAIRATTGEVLYRACRGDTHHHHIICTSCGCAEEVEVKGVEQAIREVAATHNFLLSDHLLELLGLCENCAASSAPDS